MVDHTIEQGLSPTSAPGKVPVNHLSSLPLKLFIPRLLIIWGKGSKHHQHTVLISICILTVAFWTQWPYSSCLSQSDLNSWNVKSSPVESTRAITHKRKRREPVDGRQGFVCYQIACLRMRSPSLTSCVILSKSCLSSLQSGHSSNTFLKEFV